MAKNKLTDLRNHLFETLEALKDKDKPMDIARAMAVAKVASVLVETAKVEVKLYEATAIEPDAQFFDAHKELTPARVPFENLKQLGTQKRNGGAV